MKKDLFKNSVKDITKFVIIKLRNSIIDKFCLSTTINRDKVIENECLRYQKLSLELNTMK